MNGLHKCHFRNIMMGCAGMALLALVGCQSKPVAPLDDESTLPTQVSGASDARIMALQSQLNKAGVRVITIGQEYLVSIPSTLLFPMQSPQLTWESYKLLNDLACFLQQFRKITVNVTAFSTRYVSDKREHALTLARARAVAHYLDTQDIDTRFIIAKGLGRDKPILADQKQGEASLNARIEITFRRAVA